MGYGQYFNSGILKINKTIIGVFEKIDIRILLFLILSLNFLSFNLSDNEEAQLSLAKQFMDHAWLPDSFMFNEWPGNRLLYQLISGFLLRYIEFEPFVFFAADKTDPGAYNLPLYLAFADPMYNSGLILSPNMAKGFKFVIMDVNYTEGDKIIELNAPEELYDIAALLRDNERFVVESIWSRETGEIAAVVSTTRLHNIAGKYTGKDDPVMLVRVQGPFPATGEALAPFTIGHFVAGFMRGSHNGPLMPLKLNSTMSFFDGPPGVSAAAFSVHNGKLTEPADAFDHPYWDWVRANVSRKASDIRQQGFSGPAMLPYTELEYGGIVKKMDKLAPRFKVKK